MKIQIEETLPDHPAGHLQTGSFAWKELSNLHLPGQSIIEQGIKILTYSLPGSPQ